jgi:hypothetical protein
MDDVVVTVAVGVGAGALSSFLVLGVLAYALLRRAGLLPAGSPEVRLAVQPDPKAAAAYSTLDGEDEDGEKDTSQDEDAEGADAGPRKLPVLTEPATCSTCKSFDLPGGQRLLASNPAFKAAAEWVPPWRMGRALKTKANPEYVALVAERDAAEGAARAALEQRLEAIPAEVPLDEDEQVEPALLHLDWTQFGACLTHSEIRAGSDTCPSWKPKS